MRVLVTVSGCLGWLCVGLTTVSGCFDYCVWSILAVSGVVVSLQKVKLVIVVT